MANFFFIVRIRSCCISNKGNETYSKMLAYILPSHTLCSMFLNSFNVLDCRLSSVLMAIYDCGLSGVIEKGLKVK